MLSLGRLLGKLMLRRDGLRGQGMLLRRGMRLFWMMLTFMPRPDSDIDISGLIFGYEKRLSKKPDCNHELISLFIFTPQLVSSLHKTLLKNPVLRRPSKQIHQFRIIIRKVPQLNKLIPHPRIPPQQPRLSFMMKRHWHKN